VKRHHGVTPPATGISMVYRADRHRDPAPIDSQLSITTVEQTVKLTGKRLILL
jgi:hypothetical protein